MFNTPISLLAMNRTPAAVRQLQVPAKKAAAPKTDVIDLSRMKIAQHKGASDLEMRGRSSYYIPQHLNEDGSWSLAQYIPYDFDGPLPDGAVPLPSACGCGRDHQDLLDRLADQLRGGFDAQA